MNYISSYNEMLLSADVDSHALAVGIIDNNNINVETLDTKAKGMYLLTKLKALETLIENPNTSKADKIAAAIRCAELVLPIYQDYYPNDKRVAKTIAAAKEGRYDKGAADAAYVASAYDAAAAAYAASIVIYAANAANYAAIAVTAAFYAIKATKFFYKI
jgi:hypothetical protein